ncbi:MAG: glucosaminidase domain-containing protein [Chitinophagaceae bacterium]|nr:glucosaminidase domain-containing protein [Chitinophagaceae bacterium]
MKNPLYPLTPQTVAFRRLASSSIRLSALLIILLLCLQAPAQSKYVKKFRPKADSLSEKYGIPASVILGIAIMESGSGTSRNCKLLNNHFGIIGKNDLLKTKNIKTRYKQYPDAHASYLSFCNLMTRKKFYKKLKGNMDHQQWADAISKAGYSEIPEIWKDRLLNIIRKNKLANNSNTAKADKSGKSGERVK